MLKQERRIPNLESLEQRILLSGAAPVAVDDVYEVAANQTLSSRTETLVAETGFNDNAGVNSNPTTGSPYTIGQTIHQRGDDEPGWAGNWRVNYGGLFDDPSLGVVIDTDKTEGDGALEIDGRLTDHAFIHHRFANPQTGVFLLEQDVKFLEFGAVNKFQQRPWEDHALGFDIGPHWVAQQGVFTVMDGTGDGSTFEWEDTGFRWALNQWYKVSLIIDVPDQTYEFFVNGQKYDSPDPLNFRGDPASIKHIEFLSCMDALVDNVRVATLGGQENGILANDTDPEGDVLVAALLDGPYHGNLSLSPDGTFTYVPEFDFVGVDSFTYDTSDGSSQSNQATVTIHINGTPDLFIAETNGSTVVRESELTDSYTIRLNSMPVDPVTIALNPTTSGHIEVTPQSISFTRQNWDVPRIVQINAIDDSVSEPDQPVLIEHSIQTQDTTYSTVQPNDLTVLVQDNDQPAIVFSQTDGLTTVGEDGSSDSYSIKLGSMPAENVQVILSQNAQVVTSPNQVMFTSSTWNDPQIIVVSAANDSVAEGTHSTSIAHAVQSGDVEYDGIAANSIQVQISDNDQVGIVVTETDDVTAVEENGLQDTITFRLQSQPTEDVVINLTVSDQLVVSEETLSFSPTEWDQTKSITVSALDDQVFEGDQVAVVDAVVSSDDPLYELLSIPQMRVDISDDDLQTDVRIISFASPDADRAVVTYEIMNSQSGPFAIHISPSNDNVFDSGDVHIEFVSVVESSMLTRGVHEIELDPTRVQSLVTNHFVPFALASLDATDLVAELDESNNSAYFMGLMLDDEGRLIFRGRDENLDDGPNDSVKFDVEGGELVAEINGHSQRVQMSDISTIVALGNAGNDNLRGSTRVNVPILMLGGEGHDILVGGHGNDELNGGNGRDTINGLEGDDVLIGEADRDRLFGHHGSDSLVGGDGNDRLVGMGGNDLLLGMNGLDALLGRDGDDTLKGSEGDDLLLGGRDNDLLQGEGANDRLFGHGGNDTLEGVGEAISSEAAMEMTS